ncbi:MAG: TraV family lipoprotein [Sideroxyarcus sp.]|nr:TraV family lipoprotein [Sideroxyarcus sp.]
MYGQLLLAALAATALSGCVGTGGLDAQDKFSCKAPPGISCSSLSGVYANAVQDNLPGSTPRAATYSKQKGDAVIGNAPTIGTPLLSNARVLRVWVAPWEDGKKVLHDQTFLYAVADPGHWQIAHSKKRIADQYRVHLPAARQQQGGAQQQPQPQPQPTR